MDTIVFSQYGVWRKIQYKGPAQIINPWLGSYRNLKIHTVRIKILSNGKCKITFMNLRYDHHAFKSRYAGFLYPDEKYFLKSFDIMNRRVLIEKLGFYI